MTYDKKMKKLFSILFVFALFFSFSPSVFAADDNKLLEYNNELERVKAQEKANAAKLTGIQQEIAQYMYEIAELDSEMAKYQGQLATLNGKVTDVNSTLKKNEDALQNTSQLYNSAEELYQTRLRSIYENGMPTMWDILFSSKGISDFFSRMNIYTSVLEYDKSLVSNMENQKEYIDYIKKDIEVKKLQLEQLKYDVQKSTDSLNATLTSKQKKVNELQSSESALKENNSELVKKREEALRKVEEEYARIQEEQNSGGNGSTSFPGGDFEWPVSGFTTITTRFGEIYNLVNPAGSAHTGADIAGGGIYGTPIVAIASGIITTATYSNAGYGNYVMINHGKSAVDGKNYVSLYGHQSALAVKKGDYVTKGQVIGYVGSTGNSTGPHLHLEVRINGKISDPLVQYPGIKFKYS